MFALCIESSHARGMGHLFRALNLADALTQRGHGVRFLINDHTISIDILRQRGYAAETVNLTDTESGWEADFARREGIRVWVNDRLNTDRKHSLKIKQAGLPLVTFDDRGSGAALADLHIAALAFDEHDALGGVCVLRGAAFLILNPDIARFQHVRYVAQPILVTLGGSDTWGATVRVVEILAKLGLAATVVLGPGFEHDRALEKVLTDVFVVKRGVPSMIEEMSHYGLAITGGGITPFEANAAGLPCIVIANEPFEVPVGQALERMGGSVFAGHHTSLDAAVFGRVLPVEKMSQAGMKNIGLAGTQRVVEKLEALLTA